MSQIEQIATVLEGARSIGHASEQPSIQDYADGGHRVVYQVGDNRHEDYWWGGNPYAGQESVALGGRVVWAAQYRGWVEDERYKDEAFTVLRAALRENAELYRGPAEFKQAGMTYRNEQVGDLTEFRGDESISKRAKIVYVGRYFGGLVNL